MRQGTSACRSTMELVFRKQRRKRAIGLRRLQFAVQSPMRLDEDAIDDLQVDGLLPVAHRLEHAGESEVARPAQESVRGTDDQREGLFGEEVVAKTRLVQLGENESGHVVVDEFFHDHRIGDPALQVLVDLQAHMGQAFVLADKDEVVVFGEIFEKEPQPAQGLHLHEVRVVDYDHQELSVAVEREGLVDETPLAFEMGARVLDVEGR